MSEWERIEERLPSALDWLFTEFILVWNTLMDDSDEWKGFVNDARERYERGRIQHATSDSTWDGWSDEEFVKNIREELIDATIYAAARTCKEHNENVPRP
jgi:hypothetical protein